MGETSVGEDTRPAADWFTPEGIAVAGETVFVAAQEQGLLLLDRLGFMTSGSFAPSPREYVIGRDGTVRMMSPTLDVQALNDAIAADLHE